MNINNNQIIETIINSLRSKLRKYKPETKHQPFHVRLLGKDRMALFSFIHSLNTTFGMSIFEPVAKKIAMNYFKEVRSQVIAGDKISLENQKNIQMIIDSLRSATIKPNWRDHYSILKSSLKTGEITDVKLTKVDLLLEDFDNNVYLFDLKTAKPNKGSFIEYKRTLLEWTAARLMNNKSKKVKAMLVIPYNPYYPKPYSRWTMAGMIDLNEELKVGKEFWDFLGEEGTYDLVLDCFEKAGIEMRDEIDEYFSKFIAL